MCVCEGECEKECGVGLVGGWGSGCRLFDYWYIQQQRCVVFLTSYLYVSCVTVYVQLPVKVHCVKKCQ